MIRKESVPTKLCQKCGRYFDYRPKWKKVWNEVKFCSKKCRNSFSLKNYQSLCFLIENKLSQFAKNRTFNVSDLIAEINFKDQVILEQELLEILRFMYQEKKIMLVGLKDKFNNNSFSLKSKFKKL